MHQVSEDIRSSGGAGTAPEEVRCLLSIKVVTEDEKDWKMVDRSKNKPTTETGLKKPQVKTGAGNNNNDRFQALSVFQTSEPEAVNSSKAKDGWEEILTAVDSGASETVVGEDMLEKVPTKKGEASRRDVRYEVANGVRIPNLGDNKLKGHASEWMARNLAAQVCEVSRALLSARKVVQAGNKLVFDSDGSLIEDKRTGQRMWLKEENGLRLLCVRVRSEGF